jgi:hypothetical protein
MPDSIKEFVVEFIRIFRVFASSMEILIVTQLDNAHATYLPRILSEINLLANEGGTHQRELSIANGWIQSQSEEQKSAIMRSYAFSVSNFWRQHMNEMSWDATYDSSRDFLRRLASYASSDNMGGKELGILYLTQPTSSRATKTTGKLAN